MYSHSAEYVSANLIGNRRTIAPMLQYWQQLAAFQSPIDSDSRQATTQPTVAPLTRRVYRAALMSATVMAVMLTMRRTVAEAVRM